MEQLLAEQLHTMGYLSKFQKKENDSRSTSRVKRYKFLREP